MSSPWEEVAVNWPPLRVHKPFIPCQVSHHCSPRSSYLLRFWWTCDGQVLFSSPYPIGKLQLIGLYWVHKPFIYPLPTQPPPLSPRSRSSYVSSNIRFDWRETPKLDTSRFEKGKRWFGQWLNVNQDGPSESSLAAAFSLFSPKIFFIGCLY